MPRQLDVNPLRLRQGGGVYVGARRVAAFPGVFGSGSIADLAARVAQHPKLRTDEIPPHDCPYFCPYCKHCDKIKHLLKNGLPQLPLGPEEYYNKLRLKEARQAAVREEEALMDQAIQEQSLLEQALLEKIRQQEARQEETRQAAVQEEEALLDQAIQEQSLLEQALLEKIRQQGADQQGADQQGADQQGADQEEEQQRRDLPEDVDGALRNVREKVAGVEQVAETTAQVTRKRCHKDCRCCVESCPCSKNQSNVPVLQARCICKCHRKKSTSSSSAKIRTTASAATGYDASCNVAGPSKAKQDNFHIKRVLLEHSGYKGSFTDNPKKRAKSDKVEVNTSNKGNKRKRTMDADESIININSFKRFAPEAVAKSLGDNNFENTSDGSKVPIALRCLGFKRIPYIIGESSGPRRSKRIKNKY